MFTVLSSLMFLVNSVALVTCGTYTVTDEAWFEVTVKDHQNPENDYQGRFTVALFGETAPMTVMNFVALVKGYKKRNKVRGQVSIFRHATIGRHLKVNRGCRNPKSRALQQSNLVYT